MSLLKFTSMAAVALTLGACQSLFQPSMNKPLDTRRDAFEHVKPGCTAPDCPLFNLDVIHFPSEPALDPIMERGMLQLTRTDANAQLPTSLKAYEDSFLAHAPNRYGSYLQSKVRDQHDGLVIVEVSSYLDTGAPEGIPGRDFINWSRQQQKVLTLADMLVPGEEPAFWKAAEEAHRGWLVDNGLASDPKFVKDWPFKHTTHIALTSAGIILKYDVNTIAPYALGQAEIKVDYQRLNGVIKPALFPGRG